MFLTNNISENINKILNQNFNAKYPNFNDWKNSILSTVQKFENIDKELKRLNITSEMLLYYINKKNYNKKNLKLIDDNEI